MGFKPHAAQEFHLELKDTRPDSVWSNATPLQDTAAGPAACEYWSSSQVEDQAHRLGEVPREQITGGCVETALAGDLGAA